MLIADTLVTVLRHAKGAGGTFNEASTSWSDAGRVYAAMTPGGAEETAAIGQEMAFARAQLRMRRSALTIALSTRDRLRFHGETWKISGKRPARGAHRAFFDVDVVRRIDTDGEGDG